MSSENTLVIGLNSIWYSDDHQWAKIFSNYQKKYPKTEYTDLGVIENILSDELLYHCHESILAPREYPYVKTDFQTAQKYLDEKKLLRLPCIERGGISFSKFPDIFTSSTEPALFRTFGNSDHAFPDRDLSEPKQWYLNSVPLICAIFNIQPDADFEKLGVRFYVHQPVESTSTEFPGALVVISPRIFLYFFDGLI